jgi:hypothetical protein
MYFYSCFQLRCRTTWVIGKPSAFDGVVSANIVKPVSRPWQLRSLGVPHSGTIVDLLQQRWVLLCVQCLGLCCIRFVPLALAVPATTYPAVAKQTVGLCCSIGSLAGLSPLMGPNALCASNIRSCALQQQGVPVPGFAPWRQLCTQKVLHCNHKV